MDANQLAEAAEALSEEDRWKLLDRLLDLVDPGDDVSPDEWAAAWGAEVERRIEEAEADPSLLVPADVVFADLRKKYGSKK